MKADEFIIVNALLYCIEIGSMNILLDVRMCRLTSAF